jgi:hypothetical protein
MKRLFLVVAALVLSGCAAQVANLNVAGTERSEQVRLQDLRPASEKEGEIFSLVITSEQYALYRVAESSSVPSGVRLLQHRAFETLQKPGAAPLDLKVHHLVVYRNMQAELRRSSLGIALGGVVGAVIAGNMVVDASGAAHSLVDAKAFDALGVTEFKRALYTEAENAGKGSVHIVYIDTDINGKRVFTRTLVPMKVPDGQTPLGVALESAIKYQLAQY